MRVFIGYQDIDSGAKVATEHVLESFKKLDPQSEFIVYKQPPYRFAGPLAFTRNFFWSIWDFVKVLNHIKGQLTAIYSPYYLLYLAKLFSRQRFVPFYFHLHGDQAETKLPAQRHQWFDPRYFYTVFVNRIITFLQKKTLQQAHQVFFVSKQARSHFLQQYQIKLLSHQSAIIPNGISLTRFSPIIKRLKQLQKKRLVGDATALVLLYVGRIDHKKGILELVQSLSRVKINQTIILVIIHPDIPDKYSQHYLNLLETESRQSPAKVLFLKNPAKLVDYYQIADLVILPSYQEMMPLVMLEAFACGVPFIGSAAGNMGEILQQIDHRLILSKITPSQIAEKINWFLNLSAKKLRQIIELEKKMARRFTWENSAQKIIRQLARFQ